MLLPIWAAAQNAVMNVRSRQTVSAGQTFQITFDINARPDKFNLPTVKNLTIVGGPSQGYSSFEQNINGKGREVETELPDQGARVNADPDAITQVVYNLIDNAVKFCPEGGTLALKIAQTKGGKYLVSVSNTGPTIPAEELPLVFDRFHKTDKSRSVDRDGWGLGLYIVKTIILSHEEDIYVTSRDGVTEFSFTMPKA